MSIVHSAHAVAAAHGEGESRLSVTTCTWKSVAASVSPHNLCSCPLCCAFLRAVSLFGTCICNHSVAHVEHTVNHFLPPFFPSHPFTSDCLANVFCTMQISPLSLPSVVESGDKSTLSMTETRAGLAHCRAQLVLMLFM